MPKKIKEMEILATVKKKEKAVLFKSAKQAYKIFKDMVDYEEYELKKQEHFWIMGIDSVGYVVCVYIAAIGADNRAIIDPIDMFDMALAKQSKKVIIAHNHPSERKKINPSENDFDLTNKLYHACLPFGIEIIDHIIFADKIFYSYAEHDEIKLIHKDLKYKTYDVLKPKLDEEKADAVNKGIKDGVSQGKIIGSSKEKFDIAREMLSNNEDISKILQYTKLTADDIDDLKNEMKNTD